MSQSASQRLESYVPVYDHIPQEWESARQALIEYLKIISNAVNIREIGWFLEEELLSGQQFFPGTTTSADDQQFRSVFRKVVDFGALPNAATKSVPHGITTSVNTSLVQLYAAATDPSVPNYIPIPYASPTLNLNIQMYMDATNINITTAFNWSTYTRCFVSIHYIQEL
jgi:hypothetical protein